MLRGELDGSTRIVVQNVEDYLVGNFDSNRTIDSVYFREDSGSWGVSLSNSCTFGAQREWTRGHGVGSQRQLIGDFNGDGKDDAAVFFNTPDAPGDWYVALSTGSGFAPATKWLSGHGYGSHSQLIGDFNGDGKDDSAVILSTGEIWVALSDGSKFATPSRWLPSNQCVASVDYHVYVPSLRR